MTEELRRETVSNWPAVACWERERIRLRPMEGGSFMQRSAALQKSGRPGRKKEMEANGIFTKLATNYEAGFDDLLPKRVQILAEGFAGGWDSAHVNEKLLDEECETLYARSFFEASLIFAYDHGMSYAAWEELFARSRALYDDRMESGCFAGGKLSLRQLEQYVYSGSDEQLQTQSVTRRIARDLGRQETAAGFLQFMRENLDSFSSVREKARYYFCKYLYFYIREMCRKYEVACRKEEGFRRRYGASPLQEERGLSEKLALEHLTFLKPLTKLKKEAEKAKPTMTVQEKMEYLQAASLTPGGIFDEFNYFYFGYVSADWLELLFELYGEFANWPQQTKRRIARSLSLCREDASGGEEQKALEALAQMAKEQQEREEQLDAEHARTEAEKKKLYQRGRAGEDYFRDFMLGRRDISRSVLVSFLLFVNTRISLDEDSRVTIPRLNRILRNCGFSQLRPGKEFDRFVMRFLRSDDPMEVVEEEVEKKVTEGENFYLYHVYQGACCKQEELLRYVVGRHS